MAYIIHHYIQSRRYTRTCYTLHKKGQKIYFPHNAAWLQEDHVVKVSSLRGLVDVLVPDGRAVGVGSTDN